MLFSLGSELLSMSPFYSPDIYFVQLKLVIDPYDSKLIRNTIIYIL